FAHRLYREAHFFFFFLFFFMISAWILKACASVLIWLARYVSAVFTATRSAVAACCRIALAIFIQKQLPCPGVVPAAAKAGAFAAAYPALFARRRGSYTERRRTSSSRSSPHRASSNDAGGRNENRKTADSRPEAHISHRARRVPHV